MLPSCFHLLRCPNEGIIRIETDLAALFGFRRKPVYNPQNRPDWRGMLQGSPESYAVHGTDFVTLI